jgi:hypothetical protein
MFSVTEILCSSTYLLRMVVNLFSYYEPNLSCLSWAKKEKADKCHII